MASLKDVAKSRKDLLMMDPRDLKVVEGWNAREDLGDLEELKQVIVNSGFPGVIKIYVPQKKEILLTKDGTYEAEPQERLVVDRHRRLTSVLQLIESGVEIKTVPCLPEDKLASEGDRLLRQETENSGKHLTPLERGNLYRRLVRFGWTEEEIAKKTGKSIQTVKSYLQLTSTSPEVQQKIKEGEVSATTVIRINQEASSPSEATAVINLVAENQATAEAAVEAVKVSGGDAKKAAEVLTTAVRAAKAEGKPKAKTKHVQTAANITAKSALAVGGTSGKSGKTQTATKKTNPVTLMKRIVRESSQKYTEEGVIIVASTADWKDLLKLLEAES